MLQKKVFWVAYTFLQKPSSFKFLSILEENYGADINNGTIKCNFLLTNVSKNGRWVSYTFLQNLHSFKFYCILEENCVADIINGRLLLIAAKTVFGWVTLSCKSLLQWVARWEDRLPWVACCEQASNMNENVLEKFIFIASCNGLQNVFASCHSQ